MTDLPARDIKDPRVLRAIAHPVRLRILEAVALSGPITATEIAGQVGESPANCSWHLRQLARYGFVEEAGGGTGRQRPWQLVVEGHRWGSGEESPELALAGDAASQVVLEAEYRALREWQRVFRREPAQWRDAGYWTQAMSWCTAEELAEIHDEIGKILARFLPRLNDPDSRPPGSRPVRFVAWGVPALPYGAVPPDPAEEAVPDDSQFTSEPAVPESPDA